MQFHSMNEIFRIHYAQKFNYHFDIFESDFIEVNGIKFHYIQAYYLRRWIYLINYYLVCIRTEKGITV